MVRYFPHPLVGGLSAAARRKHMNYANIKYCDIANGPGVRTSLFVSGCTHRCPAASTKWPGILPTAHPSPRRCATRSLHPAGPTTSPGCPCWGASRWSRPTSGSCCPSCATSRPCTPARRCGATRAIPSSSCWGQEPSRCRCEATDPLLALLDVLVDGPFIQAQYDISLRFRGSANQRLLDMPRSLAEGKPVLWQDKPVFSTHTMD